MTDLVTSYAIMSSEASGHYHVLPRPATHHLSSAISASSPTSASPRLRVSAPARLQTTPNDSSGTSPRASILARNATHSTIRARTHPAQSWERAWLFRGNHPSHAIDSSTAWPVTTPPRLALVSGTRSSGTPSGGTSPLQLSQTKRWRAPKSSLDTHRGIHECACFRHRITGHTEPNGE